MSTDRPTDDAILELFDELEDDLLLSAPAVDPPEGLKSRLMERLAAAVPVLSRGDEAPWEASGVEGVDVRSLFNDSRARRQTVLVRMAPGSVYPIHAHAGHEECYVVAGDLIDGELRLAAGDYTCFPEGSRHGPLSTEGGCLLLIQASLDDYVVHPEAR